MSNKRLLSKIISIYYCLYFRNTVSDKPQKLKDLFSDNAQVKKPTGYNNNRPKPSQTNQSGEPVKQNYRPNQNKTNQNFSSNASNEQKGFQKPEFKSNPSRQQDSWQNQNTSGNTNTSGSYYNKDKKPEFKSYPNKSNPDVVGQKVPNST